MNRRAYLAPRRAGLLAACVAAAGLLLAACSNSPSSSNSGGSGGSTKTPSTKSTTSGSGNSGGSTSVVSSSSEPFPIATGNTWVYQAKVGTSGETSTVTNKVVSVTPVSGGNSVTMSDNDSLVPGTTTDETFIFHSDGSISLPSNELGTTATIIKGGLFWPSAAAINSGQSTSETIEIALNNSSLHGTVTDNITVKGDGTATVTEPAGTYSANIVQMTENFKIDGYNETIVVKTWMANGVGPVQSEAAFTAAGHTEIASEQNLKSFTQG
jgi:hypothetical protein